jgi:hypothetical protein
MLQYPSHTVLGLTVSYLTKVPLNHLQGKIPRQLPPRKQTLGNAVASSHGDIGIGILFRLVRCCHPRVIFIVS